MNGTSGKMIKYTCPNCHGDNLVWEANAFWCVERQLFDLDDLVQDGNVFCYDCYEIVEPICIERGGYG